MSANSVKTEKPKKEKKQKKLHKPMKMRTKAIITGCVFVIAVLLVIYTLSSGAVTFKPGAVHSNDEEVAESETPVINDDGSVVPQTTRYNILVTCGNGGTASPSGSVSVEENGAITIGFTPDEGYQVKTVVVDGQDEGAKTSHTFSNVKEAHSLMVTFERIPEPEPSPDVSDDPNITPDD